MNPLEMRTGPPPSHRSAEIAADTAADEYFSVDVETDGPIPGPFSMLSFAIVPAGRFERGHFTRPGSYGADSAFVAELKPISDEFEPEALAVNGLDRARLQRTGAEPRRAMTDAAAWVRQKSGTRSPVLVAYPLSFDWSWLYWYFVRFSETGSPFNHSRCYDLKTAFAVKGGRPISAAGRRHIPDELLGTQPHTHRALDDAIEQAQIFANVFEWDGP